MKIYRSVSELVGNTPLLSLDGYCRACGIDAELLGKLECMNPAGSVKDRVGLSMLHDAVASGRLKPGGVLIEPTSGNTGIGLAAVAVPLGYRVIITMPSSMSEERRRVLAAYGAELILTDAKEGMAGAIRRAKQLAEQIEGAVIAGQFENPANPDAHYKTTGPEIYRDTDGRLDLFVAGVGTGGTLTGVGRYLKEQDPAIRIVAVEPHASAVLSGGTAGAHGIQGIGAGFVPATLDPSLIDEVITCTEEEAYTAAATLARTDGVLVGISSGAALAAAKRLAERPENRGRRIVVLLPDTGNRYLSTDLFS